MARSRLLVELGEITNSCFVVMPFLAVFESEYEKVIKPAVLSAGLTCERGDEIYTRQAIVADIWNAIRKARVVVAELSGRNPNVMYEIGLAHALGKPLVLLTRNEEDVPFDLRALRYVFYNINEPDWGSYLRDKLAEIIRVILENPSLGDHLSGITLEASLPSAPTAPLAATPETVPVRDLGGVWHGAWLSVLRERRHDATLIIPKGHGASFTASMTITYERDGQQTIVQETLSASLRDHALSMTGVNYTYVQQGSSVSYGLDTFLLKVMSDTSVSGTVILKHGEREVTFTRIQ